MKMKIPNSGSGNGYYGHEILVSYMSDSSSSSISEDLSLDSPALDGDFSEYMWMENEEEFEKEVMQKLEEEELMEQCMEAMMEDEQEIRNIHNSEAHSSPAAEAQIANNGALQVDPSEACTETNGFDITRHLQALRVQDPQLARQSTLNPNAQEFVPQMSPPIPQVANGTS